jgi:hypothetical protein
MQVNALPHKKFYPKKTIPHNKNLTQLCLSEGGFGGHDGVNNKRKIAGNQGVRSPVSSGKPEKKNRNPG